MTLQTEPIWARSERSAGAEEVMDGGAACRGRGEDESADFVGRKELFSGSLRLGRDTLLCLFCLTDAGVQPAPRPFLFSVLLTCWPAPLHPHLLPFSVFPHLPPVTFFLVFFILPFGGNTGRIGWDRGRQVSIAMLSVLMSLVLTVCSWAVCVQGPVSVHPKL